MKNRTKLADFNLMTLQDDNGKVLLDGPIFDKDIIEFIICLVMYHKVPIEHLRILIERYGYIKSKFDSKELEDEKES
jgi:hypothetical protein